MNTFPRKAIVCVSKFPSRWHIHLVKRFQDADADLSFIFLNEVRSNLGSYLLTRGQLIKFLVSQCIELHASDVLFDLEFSNALKPSDIEEIITHLSCPGIGVCVDDDNLHDVNKTLYSSCAKLLCNSPLSVEKHKAYGKDAMFFPLEIPNSHILDPSAKNQLSSGPLNILHYGSSDKADRDQFLSSLRGKGLNLKELVGGELSYEELYKEVSNADVILNFSKSSSLVCSPLEFFPISGQMVPRADVNYDSFCYQYKGRILEAAFSGSLCVSEWFPLAEGSFKGTLPTFTTIDELLELLCRLNTDLAYYDAQRDQFVNYVIDNYSFQKLGTALNDFLAKDSGRPTPLVRQLSSWPEVVYRSSQCVMFHSPFFLFDKYLFRKGFKACARELNRILFSSLFLAFFSIPWMVVVLKKKLSKDVSQFK